MSADTNVEKRRDIESPAVAAQLGRYEEADSNISAGLTGELEGALDVNAQSLTWTFPDHEHSPIFWTRIRVTYYRSGDFKVTCNVEDRSRHSDWDVWMHLFVWSRISNTAVGRVGGDLCFQDLDAGENYNKESTGHSSVIRDNWASLVNGTFVPAFSTWKRRDN